MSLKYAILGFLDLMPLSGYDLAKMFNASVNFYWPATHSQIYRTLGNLLEDEFVTREIVEQSDNPDKKVYSITARGRENLRRWVAKPQDLPTVRHTLLVQLAFSSLLGDEELLHLLDSHAGKLRERLALYRGDQQQSQLDYARTEKERFLWSLILENGIMAYEGELRWIEDAIQDYRARFVESGSA
jgi:DNA-binding PadR family transcriptional regulator